MSDFLDLLETVDLEDTTLLEEFIHRVNYTNDGYPDNQLIDSMALLSPAQLTLIKTLHYKNDHCIYISSSRNLSATILEAFKNIRAVSGIGFERAPKKYLKFYPTYMITKWKQANSGTTTRKARGNEFKFSMNNFSLEMFKQTITKKFLRTEAKNLLEHVNTAYYESTKDSNCVKIRNKFYFTILTNAEHITKASINILAITPISPKGTSRIYLPDEDEVLAINPYDISGNIEHYLLPNSIRETSSLDLKLSSISTPTNNSREDVRKLALAIYFTELYSRTSHEPFKALAKQSVETVPAHAITEFKNSLASVTTLAQII